MVSRTPNFEDCQGCPDWDDVNGCWKDMPYPCLDDDGEPYVNSEQLQGGGGGEKKEM